MPILLKGSESKKREAITCDQNRVNEALTRLYKENQARLESVKTSSDIVAWSKEIGHVDVHWFYGELLMMCHPSFVSGIGPELYNKLTMLHHAFLPRDSWFGRHLELGYKEESR